MYFEESEDFGTICSTALMTASLAFGIASALNFSRPTQRMAPANTPTFMWSSVCGVNDWPSPSVVS